MKISINEIKQFFKDFFRFSEKFKKKVKTFIIVLILFLIPLIGMPLVNVPYISYFTPQEVHEYKDDMYTFSNSHKHPVNGLFIEPDINTNFRVIDSINWTSFNASLTNITDPRTNQYIMDLNKPDFFFDYLFGKQNDDGSHSDIAGLGNMFSTYEVVQTLNILNTSYIDKTQNQDETEKIVEFVNESIMLDPTWSGFNCSGFKLNGFSFIPDIISTSNAIDLANNFSAYDTLNLINISNYINQSLTLGAGGYVLDSSTLTSTPETTYYGIKAFLGMNMTYASYELDTSFPTFYNLRYNNITDYGFSSSPGNASDVQSTFYALSSIDTLGISHPLLFNENKTLEYILNCFNLDGGCGIRPDVSRSDFSSGWAAMKAISLLENKYTFNQTIRQLVNDTKNNYFQWVSKYQASNGLFGHTTIESNYWGALSAIQYYPGSFINYINITNIFNYVNSCYVIDDGGYASEPGLNSTLFATYCAINLYDIFTMYVDDLWLFNESATENFLVSLQNSDGGIMIGNDLEVLLQLGSVSNIISSIIKTNMSIVASTYWALISLDILDARNLLDLETLQTWIRTCQNGDGGFGIYLGFSYSDIMSTYYGLHIFSFFDSEPMSIISAISFLKSAQLKDGSFSPMPMLSMAGISESIFLVTYLAAKALYDFAYQADNIFGFLEWFEKCIDNDTGGVGDNQGFSGDLRNTPYGLIMIDDLRYDRAFDPEPWTVLFITILLVELVAVVLFILSKGTTFVRVIIVKRIKSKLGVGEKMEISYLQRFPAIFCDNLSIYAGRKLIVSTMSLTLEHGEILGVLGESGAGKSTFVKSLLGMRKFTGISEVYGMNVKKKAKKMRPMYGYVPQDLSKIYNDFTTFQNILYFGKQYGMTEREIRRKAKRILRSLEIEDKIHEQVKNLSGGQKRRVSIAIGLIHDPVIVWMDEPTSGLDPVVRENLWLALTKINEEFDTTLIVITHYPEESRFCHKVAIFGRNRGLIDFGAPKELIAQLPGSGRTIGLIFKEAINHAVERLENIEGINKALENKANMEFSILSELHLRALRSKIELEFGLASILELKQSDSKMEEYFRYRAMDVPREE